MRAILDKFMVRFGYIRFSGFSVDIKYNWSKKQLYGYCYDSRGNLVYRWNLNTD